MIRFFVRCRAGENGTWQDSSYNVGSGCKTERDAEVLLVKLENTPANEDLDYSVVEREVAPEVRWFIEFRSEYTDWRKSLYSSPEGCESKLEAQNEMKKAQREGREIEYRLVGREVSNDD